MADGVTLLIGPKSWPPPWPRTRTPGTPNCSSSTRTRSARRSSTWCAQRPRVVAMPEKFALSPRGTALTHRIAVDAAARRHAGAVIDSPGHGGAGSPQAHARRGCRSTRPARGACRASACGRGIDVQIDGATAALVDLSTMGAQVVSTTVLKPSQRVRVVLPVDTVSRSGPRAPSRGRCSNSQRGLTPQYRAGLEFSSADPEPLLQFCLEQAAEASRELEPTAADVNRTTPPPAARSGRWCRRAPAPVEIEQHRHADERARGARGTRAPPAAGRRSVSRRPSAPSSPASTRRRACSAAGGAGRPGTRRTRRRRCGSPRRSAPRPGRRARPSS